MNRFWVFPLVLGVLGALFPFLAWIEAVIPLMWSLFLRAPNLLEGMSAIWFTVVPWGVGVGVALGLVAGTVDSLRNGRTRRGARELVGNVAWCLLYAHVFIAVNALPSAWVSSRLGLASPVVIFLALAPFLLGLIAIAWATIRTISTDDVLSPRVLMGKLKRSTQLSG